MMSKSGIARVQVESMFWIHGLPFLSYPVVVGKWRKSVTGVTCKQSMCYKHCKQTRLFCCWLSHLKMSFYHLTSHKQGKGVVYFLFITLWSYFCQPFLYYNGSFEVQPQTRLCKCLNETRLCKCCIRCNQSRRYVVKFCRLVYFSRLNQCT